MIINIFVICIAAIPLSIFGQNTAPYRLDTIGSITRAIEHDEIIITRQFGELNSEDLSKPLSMTVSGFRCFIQDTFSDKRYAEEIIPNSWHHLAQLLEHGKQTQQPSEYTRAVMKLFTQKIKAAPYLNAIVTLEIVEQVPALCQHHFDASANIIEQQSQRIEKILTTQIVEQFETFKNDPEKFLRETSNNIATAIHHNITVNRSISTEEMKFSIERFLDVVLSKTLWSPEDKGQIWDSFQKISKIVSQLNKNHPQYSVESVDDMLWTLLVRFDYFLSVAGAELPLEFYEKARAGLRAEMEHLDEIQEQEEGLKTKRGFLQQSIITAAAKAHAQQQFGIITTQV